jgi:hypothetical protein
MTLTLVGKAALLGLPGERSLANEDGRPGGPPYWYRFREVGVAMNRLVISQ